MSSNRVHSESLPRWVFCAGSSCISSPGRCCVFRSMRFLQALIPLRHRPQTMKPSKKPQVHNATTYNNFRVSWRTALMPRARGQVVSIHPIAEKAHSRKLTVAIPSTNMPVDGVLSSRTTCSCYLQPGHSYTCCEDLLRGAIGVTAEELEEQAASLEAATMPDGTEHV